MYIDQFPENDLARERIHRHGLRQFPTIAEALTLGGSKLAVDGVVIIAEHGKYPSNEKGQKLYPRYEWFKEVVKVFEASGRAVPVFNDKHLSTTWEPLCRDGRRFETAGVSVSGRLVAARHLAACRRSTCPSTRRWWKACAWATAGSTAMTSTAWRPPSACPSAGEAAKSASPASTRSRGAKLWETAGRSRIAK